jgi:hypothetical protein
LAFFSNYSVSVSCVAPWSFRYGAVRIPMKPAIDSETKPATCSDFIPASIPI